MNYVATLPISVLCAPTFALYLAVMFDLSLQLAGLLSMSLALGVTFTVPSVVLGIAVLASLAVMWQNVLTFPIPSVTLNLKLSFSLILEILLGLIATLEAIVSAVFGVGVCAYAYVGAGSGLGPAVATDLGGGWVDGTSPLTNVSAWLFVATSSGTLGAGSVASVSMMAQPTPPPQPPTVPAIPSNLYPPPQCYTAGLASVAFTPAPPGGATATGTVQVSSSVTTGVGAVTGITVTDPGSGYLAPPYPSISDASPLVSASTTTPIVLTVPDALTIPVGAGFACTVSGATGTTPVLAATDASPIVIQVPSAAGLTSCAISGDTSGSGINGAWYCKAVDATHVALFTDPAFSLPSVGQGTYAAGATLCGNLNAPHCAKVLTPTTVALYTDSTFTVPIAGYGTYSGGTVSGAGQGAVATATMGGGSRAALAGFFSGLAWPQAGLVGASLTFGTLLGATFSCLAALLSNLKTQANAAAGAVASFNLSVVPLTLIASFELFASILVNLKANLSAKAPNLGLAASLALNAQTSVIGSLVAQIAAQLSLGAGSVEVYSYSGPGSGLGAAIESIGAWHDGTPTSAPVSVVLIGATSTASADAFAVMFPGAA